jgi:hypothetical protein
MCRGLYPAGRDLTLDKIMLQECCSKKVLKLVKQRKVVQYLMGRYQVSERRAARTARSCLSTVTPGANAPVEKVSTPSELYSDLFSGLD